jgi:hypothetical protein
VGYEPKVLPTAFAYRVWFTVRELWFGPRVLLGLAALAAIPLVGAEVGFALLTTFTLFLFYLSFAHSPAWTLYYAETLPVFAFMSAHGLWRLLSPRRASDGETVRRPSRGAVLATCALMVFYLPFAGRNLKFWRATHVAEQRYQRAVFEGVASIPEPKVIVFMRYAPWHNIHMSLIANEPELQHAHAWLVYDRGADNARLRRLAPDRVAYLYDEARLSIVRYPEAGVAAAQ